MFTTLYIGRFIGYDIGMLDEKYFFDRLIDFSRDGGNVEGLSYKLFNISEDIRNGILDQSNFNDFIYSIKEYAEHCLEVDDNGNYKYYMYLYDYFIKYGAESLVNIDTIYFNSYFTFDELKSIKNSNLKFFTKCKFIFLKKFNLDYDSYLEAKRINDIFPGMLFKVNGNEELIDIKEFEKSVFAIDDLVDENIISALSPLEKLVYIYDIVRGRNYISNDDSYCLSRDLSKVLLGDDIVCCGFVNIFNYLLNKYGISCDKYYIYFKSDSKSGHVRSVVYLNDPKYNVDGIYYCDPTWDCKEDNSNNYLYGYLHFCNIFPQMVLLDNNKYKYPIDSSRGFSKEKILEEDDKMKNTVFYMDCDIDNINVSTLMYLGIDKFLLFYEKLLSIPRFEGPSINIDELIDRMGYIVHESTKPISPQCLMKAISNVRKLLYYQNPEDYPYSEDAIYCVLLNSKFCDNSSEYNILKNIGLADDYSPMSDEQCESLIHELHDDTCVGSDIKRVQFTKIMRDFLIKKQNEEQMKLSLKK